MNSVTDFPPNFCDNLPANANVSYLDSHSLVITAWNWDYQDALAFQYSARDFVKINKKFKVFIFTNHPHCFTMGRGLQKGKDEKLKNLMEFNPSVVPNLKYPIHQIKRGGGITFHYPGQWIFYPIVNLTHSEFSMNSLMKWIFSNIISVLQNHFNLEDLSSGQELAGLWIGKFKLASIGFAIHKLVTYHGLALNVVRDDSIFLELAKTNPCGLTSDIYRCIDDYLLDGTTARPSLVETFHSHFINQINSKKINCD